MKELFLALTILCSTWQLSWGQKENLQDVRNKLLCNVYDYQHADTATVSFLRANFPYLAKPVPEGGLFMPPIGTNSTREIVSMRFERHPLFHFKMKEGRIDFHEVTTAGEKFETGADLWLIFENETDAHAAFSLISDSLARVSKDHKPSNDTDQMMEVFTGDGKYRSPYTVKMILKKDPAGNFAIYLPTNNR